MDNLRFSIVERQEARPKGALRSVLPISDFDDVIRLEIAFSIWGKVFANARQEVELG